MLVIFYSKPANFGVVDLGDPQTTKPVDNVSQVLPDPPITEVQSEPKARDTPSGQSEQTPAGVRKEVTAEKTSSADTGKSSELMSCRSRLVLYILY